MKSKINVAELLKNCPEGMELDCTIWDNVIFECVNDVEDFFSIVIRLSDGSTESLTEYGCYDDNVSAKCVIFPKGKTTWEGFVPPYKFKDGDIVTAKTDSILQVFILQKVKDDYEGHCYIGYDFACDEVFPAGEYRFDRLATEEEKQKLFDAIKDNSYEWNAETKTLEKLIEPKFKVGDRIKSKGLNLGIVTITKVYEDHYELDDGCTLKLNGQNYYELVPNKFDIYTLKPFDKVLVRDGAGLWRPNLFGKDMIVGYRYFTANGSYKECIPYEGNEHLLGTNNDCDEYYKTWE